MADEDEIDILGDFSFNSCLAQNSQGIPSCSDNEDTVHPQWLLDSTANNWYDNRNKDSAKPSSSRILSGNRVRKFSKTIHDMHTAWTSQERALLVKEMEKYGRNIKKISQTITTKTEAEIQAHIDAEYGIQLETPPTGLEKTQNDQEDVPTVVREEIVTDNDATDIKDVINMVTTGSPTILIPKNQSFNKRYINRHHNSLLKPGLLGAIKQNNHDLINVNAAEIFYDDDLIIGSTESVGQDLDSIDNVSKKLLKNHKPETKIKPKFTKKIGNHRRKVSRNYDKGARPRNSSKDNLRSPQNRQRKNSSLSEDATKSPKLQIVLGSGQALPVSEGEQVIKIEKKKDSESDSDIEVDSEEDRPAKPVELAPSIVDDEAPVAVPLRKFEPMPRRQKKINLDGEGGYTIMHTASGDLFEIGAEPKRERTPRRQHVVSLIQCRLYNAERPAPFTVRLHVSALILMDAQAHASRGEVMGLVGGALDGGELLLEAYRAAAASSSRTHCDMDPVSQARASSSLQAAGWAVAAWHHSHPAFPPAPSATDLRSQAALQRALERPRAPIVGLITSQHWPAGRTASQYRCIRVESTPEEPECGFQLSVKLVADLTCARAPAFLRELRDVLALAPARTEFAVDMARDVCPQANLTHLEKCISSVSQHLRSAGYSPEEPVVADVIEGLRDIFR